MEISNGVESMKVLTENNIKTLDGKSKDIVTDNIEKLRGIFPEVFCEDKVDFEKLQEVLGNYIEDKEEYTKLPKPTNIPYRTFCGT